MARLGGVSSPPFCVCSSVFSSVFVVVVEVVVCCVVVFVLFLFVCVCFHNPSTTGATDTCCFSYRQLQNERHYSKLKKDPTVQIAKTSNELVNRLHIDGHIDLSLIHI